MQHLERQPASPRDYVPTLPTALADVILKALAKDPEARFESAGAFADAITTAAPTIASSEALARFVTEHAPSPPPLPLAPVDMPTGPVRGVDVLTPTRPSDELITVGGGTAGDSSPEEKAIAATVRQRRQARDEQTAATLAETRAPPSPDTVHAAPSPASHRRIRPSTILVPLVCATTLTAAVLVAQSRSENRAAPRPEAARSAEPAKVTSTNVTDANTTTSAAPATTPIDAGATATGATRDAGTQRSRSERVRTRTDARTPPTPPATQDDVTSPDTATSTEAPSEGSATTQLPVSGRHKENPFPR